MKAQKLFGFRPIAHNSWFLTQWVVSIIATLISLFWITTSLAEVPVPREVIEAIQQDGVARLIISLDVPWIPEGKAETPAAKERIQKQRDFIKLKQDDIEQRLNQSLSSKSNIFTLGKKDLPVLKLKKFETVPLIALEEVDSSLLYELQKTSGIKQIQQDTADEAFSNENISLIGAESAWQNGYTGEGQTVAILDTGVDKTHPLLASKVVKELCFSQSCPNGSTQQEGDGAAAPCSFSFSCEHGTHVAGIVTGVAPGTKVIATQIFSNSSGMPVSYTSDQIKALEWVYKNYNSVPNVPPIVAVNMSLGSGQYSTPCDSDSRATIINNLKSVGVAIMVASGNSGYTNAISAPACISSAISVGATDNSDIIAYFSNSASFLDLLAPGVNIYSTLPSGGMGYRSGTSMATPHVAGSWAILKSMYPDATFDSLLADLKSKGVPITDSRNNITIPRINLANLLPPQEYPLTINPSSNGTINSTDGKVMCNSSSSNCVANYSIGQTVTLQAIAAIGFVFQNWNGDCAGTSNSLTLTMNAAKTCAATFMPVYSLTITSPSNGKVTSQDGSINCGTNCTTSYRSGQNITLTAQANADYQFQQWGGNCNGTSSSVVVMMNTNITCSATFTPVYSLTITLPTNGKVTSQDGKINCGVSCITSYPSGQTTTLTAQANAGYKFQQWEGDCSGTSNPITVTMNATKSCTATFAPGYSLTITSPSNGKVTSQDGNINCGTSCTTSYLNGQTVTLTAQANAGYQFQQWEGNCSGTSNLITVTMNANKTCTATFTPVYSLTITSPRNGKVTSQDGNINCGTSCTTSYLSGQTVTLTAQANANAGYQFQQWGGDCSGTINPLIVTMNATKTCAAIFTKVRTRLARPGK